MTRNSVFSKSHFLITITVHLFPLLEGEKVFHGESRAIVCNISLHSLLFLPTLDSGRSALSTHQPCGINSESCPRPELPPLPLLLHSPSFHPDMTVQVKSLLEIFLVLEQWEIQRGPETTLSVSVISGTEQTETTKPGTPHTSNMTCLMVLKALLSTQPQNHLQKAPRSHPPQHWTNS